MECEAKKRAGIHIEPKPEFPPKVEAMIKSKNHFWNDRQYIKTDEEGELPRWKYTQPCTRELFEWLPWGKPSCFHQIQASSVELMEAISNEIQTLGEPQVKVLGSSNDDAVSAALSSSQLAKQAPECIIYAAVDEETLQGLSFSTSMAYVPRQPGGHGFYRGSHGFRGGYHSFDSRQRGRGHGAYLSHYPPVYKEEYYELEERPCYRQQNEYRPPSPPPGWQLSSPLPAPRHHHMDLGRSKHRQSSSKTRCVRESRSLPPHARHSVRKDQGTNRCSPSPEAQNHTVIKYKDQKELKELSISSVMES